MVTYKKIGVKAGSIIYAVYKKCVCFIFTAILLYLFSLAMFSTSNISADYKEHTYFVRDSVIVNLLVLIIFLIGSSYIIKAIQKKKSNTSKSNKSNKDNGLINRNYDRIKSVVLIAAFIIGMLWVVSSQFIPGADQKSVLEAALQMRMGNYDMFKPGGYVDIYPNQAGIILFIYLLGFIVGDGNYIFFQLLNVLALVYTYKIFVDIYELYQGKTKKSLVLLISLILFIPISFYVSYVYGNIIGLFLSVVAIKYSIMIIKGSKRKRDILLAVFSLIGAVVIKNNYLIFMIGIIIFLLVSYFRKPAITKIVTAVLIIMMFMLQSVLVPGIIRLKTGQELSQGSSEWSWIVMGLQKNDSLCDGWYNGYNRQSYIDSGYNKKLQGETAKGKLAELINEYRSDKEAFVKFISRKTASQWNNPTFQGLWILQVRKSNISRPVFFDYILSVPGEDVIIKIFNAGQIIILFYLLMFVILKEEKDEKDLLLMMIFIGGFLFHLFWEAKCQYTIIYYVLLIPLSVEGFLLLMSKICDNKAKAFIQSFKQVPNKDNGSEKLSFSKQEKRAFILLVGFMLVIFTSLGRKLIYLDYDTDLYKRYVYNHISDCNIDENDCYISPYYLKGHMLALADNDECSYKDVVITDKVIEEDSLINISSYRNKTRIRFISQDLYLDLTNNRELQYQNVQGYKKVDTTAQEWTIRKADEDNSFYILIGSYSALTYDEETGKVFISNFNESNQQKWVKKSSKI